MADKITNQEFLKLYSEGKVGSAVLSDEIAIVKKKLEEYKEQRRQLVSEKEDVAEQSGDNWHDGAFIATDNAAKILAEQVSKIAGAFSATEVYPPDDSEDRVTIGSRVSIRQNGDEFKVDIVGFPALREVDDVEIMPCSIESPIAKAVIGQRVGEVAMLHLGESNQQIEILGIDQQSIRGSFSHEATT